MNVASYLARIGYAGPTRPDTETLFAVHRAQQLAIPFENLDVQLQRPLTSDIAAGYDKIVRQRRGGWCYELNGVFGWALQQLGFDVTRVSAGVMREQMGDSQLGTHLCLLVQLDRTYFVDVGFGGGLLEPMLLEPGQQDEPPYQLALSAAPDCYWRFHERTLSDEVTFDFRAEPADEALFIEKCQLQQSDPKSHFVRSLIVQRRVSDTHVTLRGRVLKTLRADRTDELVIDSAEQLVAILKDQFALDMPEIARVWPTIVARHQEMFA
jgi:N-hydroxyarylamine O-acetyltransferase